MICITCYNISITFIQLLVLLAVVFFPPLPFLKLKVIFLKIKINSFGRYTRSRTVPILGLSTFNKPVNFSELVKVSSTNRLMNGQEDWSKVTPLNKAENIWEKCFFLRERIKVNIFIFKMSGKPGLQVHLSGRAPASMPEAKGSILSTIEQN